MIDDKGPISAGDPAAEIRTGYCQECGRGLSLSTLRRVGNGVFCVPCAVRQATPGWDRVPTSSFAHPSNIRTPYPSAAGAPNPARAAVLGLIPGVGAMYNGQYAKGALHLVVFVILLSLADHLSWVFNWFVWGWVFYQAFDAYHTARARRDSLPLPNPFGWNDVGDWLGFNRSAASPPPPAQPAPFPSAAAQTPPQPPAAGPHAPTSWAYTSASVPQPTPYRPYAERPSENPYAEPFPRPVADPVAPLPPVPAVAPGMQAGYSPTYTGSLPATPLVPAAAITGVRRFPVGALWLIGLGTLFLAGNLLPELRLSGRWLVPLLLAAVAIWSALRRWEQLRTTHGTLPSPLTFAGTLVGPGLLLSVAALLALDAGDLVSMRRSWPAILVVWGGLLTLQRTTNSAVLPALSSELPGTLPPPTARSTSGTGSFGL